MKKTDLSKSQKKETVRENEEAGLDTVSKVSLTFMGVVSAVIGIWAVVSFVSALTKAGPVEFFRSWFQAVTGM